MGSFHEILHQEVENRNKGYEHLEQVLEEAEGRLMHDLESERQDREETEESLVKLLEDTQSRMEQSIIPS